ncbi:MAG TPA: cyclic nucleotide-binding domain-containing protein [Desulfobacterales bacterium]|nr:cyclic nucleotide-binding domain-containing protein [Desulfobacterales bacterium]
MEESSYLKNREHLITKFHKIPFLQSINKEYLSEILDLSKIRRYEPDELITKEGDYDRWIYVIISGAVKVIKSDNEIARFENCGDTFGEMEVINGEARSASVFADTETVCLAIDGSFLDRVSPENQNAIFSIFYRLLAEILSERLRTTNNELVQVKEELKRLKKT